MEHYDPDYISRNAFARALANGAKYLCLVGCVYSVCKDERELGTKLEKLIKTVKN